MIVKCISILFAGLMLICPVMTDALRGAESVSEAIIESAEETPAGEGIAEAGTGIGRDTVLIPNPAYTGVTKDELETLAVLMYLEGGGESNECIYALACVCFNRYASGIWGETMTEVIYAPYEFEPACYIEEFTCKNEIEVKRLEEIREIVNRIYMDGSGIPERIMFFRTDYYHAWSGAVAEFAVGNVYFSSSIWCEV